MSKKFTVIGNWKMYKTVREASDFIEELIPLIEGASAHLFLAVPFTSISAASKAAKGTDIRVGAQNMNDAREGAFTGEIAALMLKEAGSEFVLLGHSERRHIFGETDHFIHRKVIRALQDDLIPILCIGETAEEYQLGKTEEVLRSQLESALHDFSKEDVDSLYIAYEPVWAIGSGQSATLKEIQKIHAFCRSVLADLFGKRKASQISILYGGSVTEKNIQEISSLKDVDGVLVGGSSLDPHVLSQIVLNSTLKKVK